VPLIQRREEAQRHYEGHADRKHRDLERRARIDRRHADVMFDDVDFSKIPLHAAAVGREVKTMTVLRRSHRHAPQRQTKAGRHQRGG
jgi:hypothetical protein